MKEDRFFRVFRVMEPVLLHFLAANILNILSQTTGLHADAASLTSITAVLLLPLFHFMRKKDEEHRGADRDTGQLYWWMWIAIPVAAWNCNILLTRAVNGLLLLLQQSFPALQLSNQTQEGLFGSALSMQIIGLGILVPIVEEVMMRGLVYRRLKDYNKKWTAILISALIFGIYHGNVIQFLFAFPMGILLALLYQQTGTLTSAIIFHVTVNLGSVLAVYGMRGNIF